MARIRVRGEIADRPTSKKQKCRRDYLHKTATKKSHSDCVRKSTDSQRQLNSSGPNHRKSRKGVQLNKWIEERMKQAIAEFKQGERGLREIARAWQVPKTTLARRVKGDGLSAGWRHASGKQPVLSERAEKELADHVALLARRGFPLTRKDIQRVAYCLSSLYWESVGLVF